MGTTVTSLKLIKLVTELRKECPLKKVSKKELDAAINEISHLNEEGNERECLNRVLGHLESAYFQFTPKTWNFIDDQNRLLWNQRSYKNGICMRLAVIHYYLDNVYRAKGWLDSISEYGWFYIDNDSLNLVNATSIEVFFNMVYRDEGAKYQSLTAKTQKNFDDANERLNYEPYC